VPAAFADTVTYPETICQQAEPPDPGTQCDEGADSQFTDVNVLLTNLGIPLAGSEVLFQDFTFVFDAVPPGDPPIVFRTDTFTFERDTGNFEFSFGFCPASAVAGIDPSTNAATKQAWNTACLGAATEIFDDTGTNVGATQPITTCASGCDLVPGTTVFFYLLPNNNLAAYNAAPGDFHPSQTTNNALRAPLNTVEDANPGELDQALSFIGGGVTLFTFEDLTRTVVSPAPGGSDEDFTDLGFSVDVELINVCEIQIPPIPPGDKCDCFLDPELEKCIPIGGEFSAVDSSALLLAGLQSSAIWILPIVLAGAGTGLGIAAFKLRRK